MAKKFSELPDAGTLTGSEVIPIVQGGFNRKVAVSDLPSGGGGAAVGKTVKAMADADQALTDAEGRKGLIQATGALTAKRRLTFHAPADASTSYFCPVLNTCSGASIVLAVGTGNPEIEVEPGAKALVQITGTGVTILVDLPLDPRDFGCPWNGVDDDLPGLVTMLNAIPVNRVRRTVVHLPKGMGYCSDFFRINRNVEIVGHGKSRQLWTETHNGLRFPPLRGVIVDGIFTSSAYPDVGADFSALRQMSIISKQAVVTDEGGNIGSANYFLSTLLDTWTYLPASVALGSVVIPSGHHVGSIQDYVNDGAARDATVLVMYRCTSAGTKGSIEPAAFATSGLAQLGATISAVATGGTAVWTVESIPKDYTNATAYVTGQRVFVPGDNDHAFECEVGGTSMGWTTTIAAGSDSAVLPQATINVADASTFPAVGTIRITTSLGPQDVAYTGKSGTTFTGCSGGTGTLHTSQAVKSPLNWAPFGVAPRVPDPFMAPAFRTVFHDRYTQITAGSDAAVLPQATIHVTTTDDFPASGSIQVWTGTAYSSVAYTGKTSTTFTGCTGGTGTMNIGNEVGAGVRWKHIPAANVTILANWVTLEDCSIFGATGNCVWIQENVNPTFAQGQQFAGGSNYWALRDCFMSYSGCGFTTNSNNTNGGESAHIQFDLLGGGRTNVDNPAYLNGPANTFGNGGGAIKDRTLGNNQHRVHYLQFSIGVPYRNDLLLIGSGNFSQWNYCIAEAPVPSRMFDPGFVTGMTGGLSNDSTAMVFNGGDAHNIVARSQLRSNPAKSITTSIGVTTSPGGGVCSPLKFRFSDDGNGVGFGTTEDMTAWPAKWFSFGKSDIPNPIDDLAFLVPHPTGAALWPSGAAVGSAMAFWIPQDRVWIGQSNVVDPPSIGFGTAPPVSGYFVKGSVVWNKNVAYNVSEGWRCVATGSPGAWLSMGVLATPNTVPFTLAWQLWFPPPFAGVPWQGQASAGPSASHNLTALAGVTAAGTPVNGWAPATFTGANSLLVDEAAWADGAGGGTIVVLCKPATTAATASAGYDEPGIFADANATAALTYTTSGFGGMQSDSVGRRIVYSAAAPNAWHSAMLRWDGSSTMGLSVDSGGEVTHACLATTGVALRKFVGSGFSTRFVGDIMEVLVIDRRLTDPEYAAIKAYFNATYGLAL